MYLLWHIFKKNMGSKRLTFETLSTAQIVKRQYTKLDLFIFSVRNTMKPNNLKIELSLTLHFHLYIWCNTWVDQWKQYDTLFQLSSIKSKLYTYYEHRNDSNIVYQNCQTIKNIIVFKTHGQKCMKQSSYRYS